MDDSIAGGILFAKSVFVKYLAGIMLILVIKAIFRPILIYICA